MPSSDLTEQDLFVETLDSTNPSGPLRFVGIAASAGGLEAVTQMVRRLPKMANSVYVIAQHMSPTHTSLLSSLIARQTELPVLDLEGETLPVANSIYVTPPNSDVIVQNGKLVLQDPSSRVATPKPSADRFFKSLAEECGQDCVGVVLSGTGSDGNYGVRAIREAGGITIAQDPKTAKYDGMPATAIATGCVDLTLPPDQIGVHLKKILAYPRDFDAFRGLSGQPNPLGDLFSILLGRTRINFADYKEKTVNRRISRRMTALSIEDYDQYVDYCRTNSDEVDALHRDLLISVTHFFRNPEQFEQLRREIQNLVATRSGGPIRIWVIGCATGEEAYSIAILLADALGGLSALASHNVQIFGTDIDQTALDFARRGIYPVSSVQDVPEEFLNDYFTIRESEVLVRPELRAAILFSHHNVFRDPPFNNIDLISFRNVLIYFNALSQERVLGRVHYSLSQDGLLFLGTSETVGEMGRFFEKRSGADKIFGKRRASSQDAVLDPNPKAISLNRATPHKESLVDLSEEPHWYADMSLAKSVASNGFVATVAGSIIEVLGDISPFVEIRAGVATALNVKMLREPLRTEAMSLIAIALRQEEQRAGQWYAIDLPGYNQARLQAFPFANKEGGELHCLVAINTKFEEQLTSDWAGTTDGEQLAYVDRMEQEIKSIREALHQSIEELQTANEELQLVNEELQSTNEEFQATNEELETSNEELQSTNEELMTVNEELSVSSFERLALASELEATLASVPYTVALADQGLMLRRMSDAGLGFFGLAELPSSGIHLSQCKVPAGFPALAPLANSVLRTENERRIPVLSEGRYYWMIMSPVSNAQDAMIGLSITITQHDGEPLAQVLDVVSKESRLAHWTYNLDTETLIWSPAMFELLGREPSGAAPLWEDAFKIFYGEDRLLEKRAIDRLIMEGGAQFSERRAFGPDGHILTVQSSVTRVDDLQGHPIQLVGVLWDTSREVEAEIVGKQLAAAERAFGLGLFSFDADVNRPIWNARLFEILGCEPEFDTPSIELMLAAIHLSDREVATQSFARASEEGALFVFEARLVKGMHKGAVCIVEGAVQRVKKERISHIFGNVRLKESGAENVTK